VSLTDQFDALTLESVGNYVTSRQEENLTLDFKLINRADLNHSDDKKNLAKALSGFANSSGGLIVWGVDARKDEDGTDCAIDAREIQPISQLLARLNELTSRAVDPPVDGVGHKAIVSGEDKGFAVTFVPESESGPHMAKLGEDRYYKRSGDTFYRMEHFDLEDMFGRRKKPKLTLEAKFIPNRAEILIGVRNEGRGTAKAPYLSFVIPDPLVCVLTELMATVILAYRDFIMAAMIRGILALGRIPTS
jgi:Putative DNA-binding domain